MTERAALVRRAGQALVVLVLAALYAPVAMIFAYSFNASRIGSVWTGFSVRWYGELARRRELWDGLQNSLVVGLAASTASVALGALAAVGLQRWRAQPRRLAQGLLALPLVIPDIIMAIALGVFFHATRVPRGFGTIVLAHVAFGLSYAYVVVTAAVHDLDESLHAAALDCGATPWRAFWAVTVPILAPSLVVAWLLVFSLSFDDFLITFFTKGVGSDTLPIEIYSRMRFGVRPDTNALFGILFLATLAGVGLAGRMARRGRATR